MTFNDKGFQPLMTLNSAIKGVSPLSFIVIRCHCALPKFSVLRSWLTPRLSRVQQRSHTEGAKGDN